MSMVIPENATKPLVSVIIVSWNAKKYVRECLETLFRTSAGSNLEVILVDNASSDGTPDLVAAEFPAVKLIRGRENLGFARGNNIGIRQSTGEYVCLVNSDIKFLRNCFDPMIEFLRQHPDVGIIGPKMLAADLRTGRSTMRFPTVWNMLGRALGLDVLFRNSRFLASYLMTDFDHNSTRDVDILNGWFWMVPRRALDEIGLLDERFFMYGEDMDWCCRFHHAGKRVVFFAGTEAVHYGGSSSSAAPVRFSIEQRRADWQFFKKHYRVLDLIALRTMMILHHGLRAAGYGFLSMFKHDKKSHALLRFQSEMKCLIWFLRPSPAEEKFALQQ